MKTGLGQPEAANMVAKELNQYGVKLPGRGDKQITGTTVINWRDKLVADFGKGLGAEIYEGMKQIAPLNPDDEPDLIRAAMLKAFRGHIQETRAKDS